MLSFFPRGVLDEILNLIESVSEGFPSYFWKKVNDFFKDAKSFILPYLHKVYNNIFDSGVYPEI